MKKLIYIMLIFSSLCVKAQETANPASNKVRELVTSLDSFRKKTPVEKVHLHLDKPYYSLGDTLWIKAYVVNERNELSALSKILHIDLVNDKGLVKTNITMPITKGLGWGAITLSDSLLQEGNYHIRAYTNVMRNFGADYFFDKVILIGNALPPPAESPATPGKKKPVTASNNIQPAPVKSDPNKISIQFFPEGGDLVNGLSSKIGFKAVGDDGLSREISGYVVGRDNKQIVAFKSEHAGMGTFMLKPAPGNTYTAVVKFRGNEKRIEIPKAKEQGFILSVTQNEDDVVVNINASAGLLQSGTIALVGQANNTVQYAASKPLNRTSFNTVIPKDRFPEGIVQFTLFSPDFQPVAERLVYVHHADSYLKINVAADKPDYKRRDKVHLDLQVTDLDGRPVTGAFSLAVTDETKVPYNEANEKTILSNLLLSADLKGYIEQPNYYFTADTTGKVNQLDNLLLTQGWRRFVWKDIMLNTIPPPVYRVETGVGISGQILASGGKPAEGVKVFLLFDMGSGVLIDTVTNNEGRFSFGNFPFRKGVGYNISLVDPKGNKNLKIQIDKPNNDLPGINNLPDEHADNDNLISYVENSRARFVELKKDAWLYKPIELKEVDIRELAVKNSTSLAGPGNADQVLTFVDLMGCQSDLSKCLVGRINGVQWKPISYTNSLTTDSHTVTINSGFLPYSRGYDDPMTIIVDGIERSDGLSVMSENVASVEVLRGGGASSLYGLHGAAGVIVITTKRGDINYEAFESERRHPGDANAKQQRGLMKYTFAGYDMRREFYSPDYSNPQTNTLVPDLRSTIYWKPSIITNTQGKAGVDFFNADGSGNYRVIVEGLAPEGKLGRQVYHYTVK